VLLEKNGEARAKPIPGKREVNWIGANSTVQSTVLGSGLQRQILFLFCLKKPINNRMARLRDFFAKMTHQFCSNFVSLLF
jgi:hypothetical protein